MTCTLSQLKQQLSNNQADSALTRLYGRAALSLQKSRYQGLLKDCLLYTSDAADELRSV